MLNKINMNSKKQILIIYVCLTIVTCAVFWQVNHYAFVNFDDAVYVTKNIHIQSGITLDGFNWAFSTRHASLWNPLVWLSFMFDYQFYGLNAGGYHLTNLILHTLSTLLLFWLFCRMTGAVWKSAFVAALFALHPLHVESVAWIAERKDVLSAFFWMLTLCLYVYYTEKPRIGRYLLVLFSFGLALMSKPMVVTLPIAMLLLDYWPLSRYRIGIQARGTEMNSANVTPAATHQEKKKTKPKKGTPKKNTSSIHQQKSAQPASPEISWQWLLWEKIPFFVLSSVLVITTLFNQNAPDITDTPDLKQYSFITRLANAPVAFVTYLEKTFWPHDMAVLYPFIEHLSLWQVTGTALLILVITAFIIVMAKRLPFLFVGWLWFSITIAPVIGIIQISLTAPYAMADRYHYLPSIGIAMMLAWGIPSLIKSENIRKKLLFPAAISFLVVLSVLTWRQCTYWKSSIELWNHTLQVTRDNYLAYNNRGVVYKELEQYQKAIDDYNEALRLKPDHAYTYNNRGNVYNYLGQDRQAIEDYNQAIRIRPYYANAYKNRGIAYFSLGNNEQGCSDAKTACELGNCKLLELTKNKVDCH